MKSFRIENISIGVKTKYLRKNRKFRRLMKWKNKKVNEKKAKLEALYITYLDVLD